MISFAVILPAAGTSSRFGSNKLAEKLFGKPVIVHTLRAFLRRDDVSNVIVPTRDFASIAQTLEAAGSPSLLIDPRVQFCAGGDCRARSVLSGLGEVPAAVEWVAIHDAARPLVLQNLIDETLAAAVAHGAAVPALPMHLTVKQATGPLPAKVQRTVPRADLWTMQTPQIARRAELLAAFETSPLPLEQVTDDVQVLELAGREVWLVSGDEKNLKITTAMDLKIAELLLRG